MRYMLLIYDNETEAMAEAEATFPHWMQYTEDLKSAGKMLGGGALKPTATATTVAIEGQKVLTTDGPFAETKEQLGGYYLIEAKDLDEAIAWASKMPHTQRGGRVEVRPLMEFEQE